MNTFPKTITIDKCEKLIKELHQNEVDDLELPAETVRFAFGGLATAIQAINTWCRKSQTRHLFIKNNISTNAEKVDEIIARPHKFSAAMMARSIQISDDPENDIRTEIIQSAIKTLESQSASSFGQSHGGLCWFTFVDHSSKGFDRNFYFIAPDNKPMPRQQAQIESIIKAMIEKSLKTIGGGRNPNDDEIKNFGRMFFELFINTHEHGSRKRSRSEWLKPGMRTIYTNGVNFTAAAATNSSNKLPVLQRYLEQLNHSPLQQRRFVEISIIDSGLGFCGRWLADRPIEGSLENLNHHEEYEIFRRCFSFRQTSSGVGLKGHGLPVVMDRLTKLRGFIRVRSNHLSLYRDFLSNPYTPNDDCQFFDWQTQKLATESLSCMPEVSGVAVTILIPLEPK